MAKGLGPLAARRTARAPAVLVALTITLFISSPPLLAQPQSASQSAPRDEILWHEIEGLSQRLPPGTPFPGHFDLALQKRRALVEKARSYLVAYPGGPRRDDAVRLELTALFEIAVLSGGSYGDLRTRVRDYLDHPPSESAASEATYWAIQLGRLDESPAAKRLATGVTHSDRDLLNACRILVDQHPNSRLVPRVVVRLFDDAVEREDWAEAGRLGARLRSEFAEDTITKQLTARLRRHEATGQTFAMTFAATDGTWIDTRDWLGQPVLVVFWASFDEHSRRCVAEIEAARRQALDLRVVGVCLDSDEAEMDAACRELDLSWPQHNDGLGWAGPIAVEWGIRRLPRVLVVDRAGRLTGLADAVSWRELLEPALRN